MRKKTFIIKASINIAIFILLFIGIYFSMSRLLRFSKEISLLFIIPMLILSLPAYIKGLILSYRRYSDGRKAVIQGDINKNRTKCFLIGLLFLTISAITSFYAILNIVIQKNIILGIILTAIAITASIISLRYIKVKVIGL